MVFEGAAILGSESNQNVPQGNVVLRGGPRLRNRRPKDSQSTCRKLLLVEFKISHAFLFPCTHSRFPGKSKRCPLIRLGLHSRTQVRILPTAPLASTGQEVPLSSAILCLLHSTTRNTDEPRDGLPSDMPGSSRADSRKPDSARPDPNSRPPHARYLPFR